MQKKYEQVTRKRVKFSYTRENIKTFPVEYLLYVTANKDKEPALYALKNNFMKTLFWFNMEIQYTILHYSHDDKS